MAKLTVFHGEGTRGDYKIRKDTITIGRTSDCDVAIPSSSVSRCHARVERRVSGYYLIDNKSTNGTLVNGTEVTETRLSDGDEIYMGDAVLLFSYDEHEYEDTAREINFGPADQSFKSPYSGSADAEPLGSATSTTSLSPAELQRKISALKAHRQKDVKES